MEANLKIKNPNFTFNLIKGGSVGFAESYMKNDFETKNFLNSFFSQKFAKNRKKQMNDLNNFVDNYKDDGNLVFVTHYVVISEALNYAPSSGEIVVADKKFNKISSFEIKY